MWRTCFSTDSQHPLGTYFAPHLVDLFLLFYVTDFRADLIQKKEHFLARSFDLNCHYKDDVLSLNNPSFGDFKHRTYPIKNITGTIKSISNLDILLEIVGKGKLMTKLYEKCDDFSFRMINFPSICGNIPSTPAY